MTNKIMTCAAACAILLITGCTADADKSATPPAAGDTAAGAKTPNAPPPAMIEQEKKNAAAAAQASQQGTEQFKAAVKQGGK